MNSKKVLSLVLAGAMALSSNGIVFASTNNTSFTDVKGNYEQAVGVLNSLGVIDGYEDGTFRPTKTITRAELAKVLVEALGYGNLVSGAKSNFSDTQGHWADGYISIASGTGLVKGDGNGTFRPNDTVSYDEAFTMIVRALGYTDNVVKGTWPTNFKIKATELDLTDDVAMSTSGADRGGVAQALYNALEANLVSVNSDGDVNYQMREDGKTPKMLLDKLCNLDESLEVSPDTLDKDSKHYAGNIVDLAPYMYQTLEVYTNDDDEVIYVKDSKSAVVEGVINTDDDDTDVLNIKDSASKNVEVPFNDDVKVYFNGAEDTGFDMNTMYAENDKVAYEKVTVVATDEDEDGKIDKASEIVGVIINQQTKAAVIDNVYRSGRTKLDVFNLPVDEDGEVDLSKVLVTGDASEVEEIEKGDVVVAYEANGTEFLTLVVERNNTKEGKVTRIDDETGKVYINRVAVEVSKASSSVYDKVAKEVKLELGDEGTFFLDHNGKIVDFEVESVEAGNYGIVIGTANGAVEDGSFDFELEEAPAIKIATADGEVVVFELAVEIDDEDGTIEDGVTYNTTENKTAKDLLVTTESSISGILNVEFATEAKAGLAKGQIIKYNLNDDDEIDAITLVTEDTLTAVKTDITSFVLDDNAVIFENDGSKYPLVSERHLDSSINGTGYYNEDGELEVILVNSADIEAESDEVVYALLEKASDIGKGYNDDEDIVQIVTLYINGEVDEFFAEEDDTFTGAVDGAVYKVEFDGDVIIKATKVTPVEATVVSVSSDNTRVKLTIDTTTAWYALAEDATMLEGTDFVDLSDLDAEMTLNVVVTGDEVDFFSIVED